MIKWLRRVVVTLVAGAVAGFVLAVPLAAAQTIAQSFQADKNVVPGRVVSLKAGSSTSVQLSPAGQSQRIYGVAIDPSLAPVTLQRQSGQQVFVATSGTYPVSVSSVDGPIAKGDYLSISSADGVASKAGQQAYVLGQALQNFSGSSGEISVAVLIQRNPLLKDSLALPSFLRSVGDSVAGKEVGPVRVYAALAAFLVACVIAFSTLAIGIRTSLTSIGRNPLSRHLILNGLVQVIIVGFAVLILGLFSVYLLLKL